MDKGARTALCGGDQRWSSLPGQLDRPRNQRSLADFSILIPSVFLRVADNPLEGAGGVSRKPVSRTCSDWSRMKACSTALDLLGSLLFADVADVLVVVAKRHSE
jgi:hypothetical protein